jgi:hypothetical protein
MKFRTWLEQSVVSDNKNEIARLILDRLQEGLLGKRDLKKALSTSFDEFSKGDNPGANVIREVLSKNDVFTLMKKIGLDAAGVDKWLQSGPQSTNTATIGGLLEKIFGEKADNIINKREFQPSSGRGEEEPAALTPDQIAAAQQQQNQQPAPVEQPQQTMMPDMSPNPAHIPPQPGGPSPKLPPAPMGAATGMF